MKEQILVRARGKSKYYEGKVEEAAAKTSLRKGRGN